MHFAVLFLFGWGMCFWTIKLKAAGGIQICVFTVDPSWLLGTWVVMVESLGFQQMPVNVILLVQVWEGGSGVQYLPSVWEAPGSVLSIASSSSSSSPSSENKK